jgi:hypothetical protein
MGPVVKLRSPINLQNAKVFRRATNETCLHIQGHSQRALTLMYVRGTRNACQMAPSRRPEGMSLMERSGNAGCDDLPCNGVSGLVRYPSLYRHCIFNEPGMGHCTPIAFSMTRPSRWGLSALSRRPRSGRGRAALDRYPCCTAVSAVLAKPRFCWGSRRPRKIQVPLEFQGLAPRLATAPSLRI